MEQDRHAVDTVESERNCSQFDLLLVAIPLALLAGVGSVVLFPIPQFVGVSLGAAVAACLVAYGVYAITQSVSATAEDASENYTVAD